MSWGPFWLGLMQGLTEFLPISSSGHLLLLHTLFEIAGDDLLFDLVLHLGTLVPVLVLYRADLWRIATDPLIPDPAFTGPWWERQGVRLAGLVVLGSVPTALIGLALEDVFEALFSTPFTLIFSYLVTGTALFATRWAPTGATDERDMRPYQALAIGLIQGIAIIPGISRSGSTIVAGLFLGMKREYAARFSFLLSIPAILGAFVLKASDADWSSFQPAEMLGGAAVAMVTGYLALVFLVRLVKQGDFRHFAWYCWGMSVVSAVVAFA